MPTSSNPGRIMFSVKVVLADRSPFLSIGSSLLQPDMTWLLKALPGSHDVDMHVSVLAGINGISYVLMLYFFQQEEHP